MRFFWVSLLLFAMTTRLYPQESSPLLLEEVVREAIDKNPQLQQAKHESLAVKATIGPVGAYPDPMLAFEFSNYPVDSFSSSESAMTGKVLRFRQRLPFPGKNLQKRRSQQDRYGAYRHDVYETQNQLIFEVKEAYYKLFLAYRKLEIVGEKEEILEQLVSTTDTIYQTGRGRKLDVVQAQLSLSETRRERLQQEQELKSQEARLNELMNRAAHSPLGKPELVELGKIDTDERTPEEILEVAIAQRPRLQRVKALKESYAKELSYARWDYLPDFEVGASYRFRDENPGDDGTDFASAFVGLSLPLYFFQKQNQELEAAKERLRASKAEVARVLQSLNRGIYEAFYRVREMRESIELYSKHLIPEAQEAVELSDSAYRHGDVEFLTRLDSETALIENRLAQVENKVQYYIAIADLELQVGLPLDQW